MSWEELLEPGNREILTASIFSATALYAVHKNDWGAELETTYDLEKYVEEASIYRPIQQLKSRKYRKELEKRRPDYGQASD